MVYVDSLQPNIAAFPCEEVPGESSGTFAYRKPNGKYLSLDLNNPAAPWTEAPAVGAWESFKKGATALVMDLEWNGHRYVYIRPFVEIL